ncbi:MAG: DUF4230 domain-containing protein [Bacteroidota bacterium]
MKKVLLGIVIGIGLFFAAGYFFKNLFTFNTEPVVIQSESVLLEKVKKVAKMVTVEGYFSEILDHKDYYQWDVSFLRKKALVAVNAKVSIGYDLQKMHFEVKPQEKVLVISQLPDPEIISIDHDTKYYDITEGVFNSFSAEELTALNAKAKRVIEEKAKSSDLFLMAESQMNGIIDLIKIIAEESGFEVKFETRSLDSEAPEFPG